MRVSRSTSPFETRSFAGLVLALLAACGGESGDPFTLQVLGLDSTGENPISGAAVAVDRADGSRTEGTTSVDGMVSFDHVNGAGPFAFTVAAAGYVAVSTLDVTQGGSWKITLVPFGADPSWVDLTGLVEEKKEVDHSVVVSATVPSSVFNGSGPEYSLRMASQPASLIVVEVAQGPAPSTPQGTTTTFVQWAQFSVDPSASSSVDLALPGSDAGAPAVTGESMMPMSSEGTLAVPASLKGASGNVRVSSDTSSGSAFLGGATSVELAPDGVHLDYTAEYVDPSLGDTLQTTYSVGFGDLWSFAETSGPPGGDIEFLDPPSLASPQTLYGALPVKGVAPGLVEIVQVEADDTSVVWRVFKQGTSNDTGMSLPRLPSAIDPRIVLGTGRVSAVPEVCKPDPASGRCTQWAQGIPADLVAR